MDWQKRRAQQDAYRQSLEMMDHETKQKRTFAEFVGGAYDGCTVTEWEVEQKLCNGQHSYDGTAIRAHGGTCHHAVLDNCPMVDGYLSPMWDGDHLRYETQEVYNMMSM